MSRVRNWPERSLHGPWDTPTLEHMDGDGRVRKRVSEPVGFLPMYPVTNLPHASPRNYHFQWPDDTPWYQQDGG